MELLLACCDINQGILKSTMSRVGKCCMALCEDSVAVNICLGLSSF